MSSVIAHNSKNAHIFLEEDMFTDKIEPIVSNGVATIAGNDLNQRGIETVIWSWNCY